MTENTLRILHFNDGYDYERTPYFVKQFLNRVDSATLKIFSGDILSPSFVSNSFEGRQFIPLFQKLGIDAMVPGNHEYDFGVERFQEITEKAGIEWLMSNLMFKAKNDRFLDCKDFYIKTIGNFKVGMFGIVDQSFIDTSNLDETKYNLIDPIEVTKQKAAYLRSQGCDFVIVITHNDNPTDFDLLENEDVDVDFILGGHIHIFLAKRFKNKLMVKSGFDFTTFSEINIQKIDASEDSSKQEPKQTLMDEAELNTDKVTYLINNFCNGNKNAFKVELIRQRIDDKTGEFDVELKTEADRIIGKLSEDAKIPLTIFEDEVNLKAAFIRANETQFKNLTCDVLRICLEIDVIMINSGHFRPETAYPKGHIYRYEDLMKTFALLSAFSISLAKGRDLLTAIDQGVSGYPTPKGSYPSVSGMALQYDSNKPAMGRVLPETATVNGHPVDLEKVYTFCTLAFVGKGKDGFTCLADLQKIPCMDITSLKAMNDFLTLPTHSANRVEFSLVKPYLQEKTLDHLLSLMGKSAKTQKTISRITKREIHQGGMSFNAVFSNLTKVAQKRIMYYKLAEDIREVEGRFVFIFDPKIDDRIKRI